MLSEIERDALEDIRDNIARAVRFVAGLDLDGFLADDKLLRGYALPRNYLRGFAPSAAGLQGTISRNPLETGCRFRQNLSPQLRERPRASNLGDDP